MRPAAIHQFHSGSAFGDAITNGLFFARRLLRDMGFESEIYVELVAPEYAMELKHYSTYRGSSDQVLLVHHSLGHNLGDWVLSLPDKKILVYHNITPETFFPEGSVWRRFSKLGREQLAVFKPSMATSICDSAYNAKELISLGYDSAAVVPLLVDVNMVRRSPWDHAVGGESGDFVTLLFVGRISENKCQHDIIEVFRHLLLISEHPCRLVFVGGYEERGAYYLFLRERLSAYGISDLVIITGKVSTEELFGWYRTADVFLCMSEHEGFCVPLLESMALDLPVVAFRSSAVPDTLGEAGIMVTEKRMPEIAAIVNRLSKDRPFRRELILGQRRRLDDFSPRKIREGLAGALARAGVEIASGGVSGDIFRRPAFQIEGPLETSYSLAIINRELALALERKCPGDIAAFATEGPGDYQPDGDSIERIPGLAPIWKKGTKGAMPDVLIRNLYPPRVHDMDGLINLLYFAWEEAGVPSSWVRSFNRHLDGILALSSFVKKVLVDAGVKVPIEVVGCGTEHITSETPMQYGKNLGKHFRFLHVSSCFPRKGVDILLRAYAAAFTASDDVSLVIKSFPNIHNSVERQIRQLQISRTACPDILLINEDLPPGAMVDIFRQCDALVAPSRGEGFGLPLAEAMSFGLPVITTGYGGQNDFCTDETAWLIDYRFEYSKSHMNLFDSVWAEPDVQHLAELMRALYETPKTNIMQKTKKAKELLEKEFTWEHCANRVQGFVTQLRSFKSFSETEIKLGWVTTWNARCGIAAYSKFLIDNLKRRISDIEIFASRKDCIIQADDSNVKRCWDSSAMLDLSDLEHAIIESSRNVVVIQFNFGFFELGAFGDLLQSLHFKGIKTILMFHSTKDVDRPDFRASLSQISRQLALADRLLVHGVADLNNLKEFGLVNNVALFPQGAMARPIQDLASLRKRIGFSSSPIIAAYGFLLPHKGIQQLIEAFPDILRANHNALLLLVNALYPNPLSEQVKKECVDLIAQHGIQHRVMMINDFLDDEESLCLLECADLIVFPYQQTSESSSAAVRGGLSTNRPVACTPLDIFEDVRNVVYTLPGFCAGDIAQGILDLLGDKALLSSKAETQQGWLDNHAWPVVAERLYGMIEAVIRDGASPAYSVRNGGMAV